MMQDLSWQSGIAVIVAYTYSYAQVLYLRWVPGDEGWTGGGLVLVIAGLAALIHRIRAEERILARNAGWSGYAAAVRYRLLPGLW